MEWIKVSDRLPVEGQLVDICYTPEKYVGPDSKHYMAPRRVTNLIAQLEKDDDGEYLVLFDDRPGLGGTFAPQQFYCHLDGEYSHWMPTPELPKEYIFWFTVDRKYKKTTPFDYPHLINK